MILKLYVLVKHTGITYVKTKDLRTDFGELSTHTSSTSNNAWHSDSICVLTDHHELSWRVTVPYAACIQCILLQMSI